MIDAPRVRISDIELREHPVVLRMPFRFGVITLHACPQAVVRVRVEAPDGRSAIGLAAEMLAPKWFDKGPAKTHAQNLDDLRAAVHLAREAYLGDETPATAFGHFARHHDAHLAVCAARGMNPLLACYGPALLDRAVLDAVCRLKGLSFMDAMRVNLPGLGADHPAFAGFDAQAWLAGRHPHGRLRARHTVGIADPLTEADVHERLDDGLPQTLVEVIARYGHRHFKLKIGGDVQADLARLRSIAAVLGGLPSPWWVTLDGNEQYADVQALRELLARVRSDPALQRLADAILFVEQPLPRALALHIDVNAIASPWPLLIDESDGTLDAFVRARACGWRGVSSKTCKGLYKSLLNALRCELWNTQAGDAGRFFLSGEDLTLQAGLALQQDLLLADLLGLAHVERNGHHYVDGLRARPEAEQAAFAAAHPDLYEVQPHPCGGTVTRLRIRDGSLVFDSLARPGYGSDVAPDLDAMTWMPFRAPAGEMS